MCRYIYIVKRCVAANLYVVILTTFYPVFCNVKLSTEAKKQALA